MRDAKVGVMQSLPPDLLITIYNRLIGHYGVQSWWPPSTELPITPFEIIVGAILTQGTNWRNVERSLHNLAAAACLDPTALHQLPTAELIALIKPSGYYNAKARKLQAFTAMLLADFGGDLARLFSLPTAQLRATLLAVWGIGPETADDIILYAAGQPIFIADAYTRRIFHRLGYCAETATYDQIVALFANLAPDVAVYKEYHALLDVHGNRTCRPRPHCGDCPLLDLCPSGRLISDGLEVGGTLNCCCPPLTHMV